MVNRFKKFLVVTVILAFFLGMALAHEEKGMPKQELKALFPTVQSFVPKLINLNDQQHEAIEKTLQIELGSERKSTAYVAVANGRSEGLAWITHAKAPKGDIGVGVAVNTSGSILKVVLFETKDKALNSPAFLRQFSKKYYESKFTDIKLPKGKEAEGKAIVLAVRKALLIMDTVIAHAEKDTGRPHTEK